MGQVITFEEAAGLPQAGKPVMSSDFGAPGSTAEDRAAGIFSEADINVRTPRTSRPSSRGEKPAGFEETPTPGKVISLEEASGMSEDRIAAIKSLKSIGTKEFQETNLFMQLGASLYKHLTGQVTEGSLAGSEKLPAFRQAAGMGEEIPWYKQPLELARRMKSHPESTLVELGKGVLYDPELLAIGAVRAPTLIGRVTKGAAVGGGFTGAQSLAKQSVEKDTISGEEVGGAAFGGAVMGGTLAGVFGRAGKKKLGEEPPAEPPVTPNAKAREAWEVPQEPVPATEPFDLHLRPKDDALANARQKAYDLISLSESAAGKSAEAKGTILRQIEAARKNPLVAKALQEVIDKRNAVRQGPMGEVQQGEWLPADRAVEEPKIHQDFIQERAQRAISVEVQRRLPPPEEGLTGEPTQPETPPGLPPGAPAIFRSGRREQTPEQPGGTEAEAQAIRDSYKPSEPAESSAIGEEVLKSAEKSLSQAWARRLPKQSGNIDPEFAQKLGKLALAGTAIPLGALMKTANYTAETLKRLPQNRFEFKKETIESALKQQDITKAERETFQAILADVPGDTITAKQLTDGFKVATQDFALEKKATDQYADYGLENIERASPDNMRDAYDRGEMTVGEEAAYKAAGMKGGVAPVTNLWRLPDHMKVSDANHFGDDQLYGWTRSFEEGGVPHVVEIQSDLMQHAKPMNAIDAKVLQDQLVTIREAYANNLKEAPRPLELITADLNVIAKANNAPVRSDPLWRMGDARHNQLYDMNPAFKKLRDEFDMSVRKQEQIKIQRMKMAEIDAALSAGQGAEKLSPIIKHWPRRLIREELADAAKSGTPMVRFATADTVAKVEGWPVNATEIEHLNSLLETNRQLLKADIEDRAAWDTADMHKTIGPSDAVQKQLIEFNNRIASTKRTIKEAEAEVERLKALGPIRHAEHQSIYDRYQKDITPYLRRLGGRDYTDPQGHTWVEVPTPKGPPSMYGHADPRLLAGIAGAGLGAAAGAYLAQKDKLAGGAEGAILGALAPFLPWRRASNFATKLATPIQRRVDSISPTLGLRLSEFERVSLDKTHQAVSSVDPFLRHLDKVETPIKAVLSRAILTNDIATIKKLFVQAKNPELLKEWENVRATLQAKGKELQDVGALKSLREDYFPRLVIDRDGLLASLGLESKTALEKALHKADLDSVRTRGHGLTEIESSEIINRYLQSGGRGSAKPGLTKQRVLDEVTEKTQPFYASPATSLHVYLRSATNIVEQAKFFGKDLVKKEANGQTFIDLESSIGKLVDSKLKSKEITFEQAKELGGILRSRFGPGERSALGGIQDIKNVAYAGLLGNPLSSIGQLADIGTAAYVHGLKPTFAALINNLTGQRTIHLKDFGLINHISSEFVDARKSAKFLNGAFKYGGFELVDRFGKEINLNAAWKNYQVKTQTSIGLAEIKAKYGEAFGAEFPTLVSDLQAGRLTENTKAVLFSELAKVQPISKSQLPQAYLDHPNGRILYMLKTFMLTQLALIQNDSYKEIMRGNVKKGLGNLTRYAVLLGGAGVATDKVKDWMLGRKIDFEATDIPINFFKNFGWTEYALHKAQSGHPIESAVGTLAPPYKMMDDIIRRDPKAINYVPIVGKLIYAHELGGKEKAEKLRLQREYQKTDVYKMRQERKQMLKELRGE